MASSMRRSSRTRHDAYVGRVVYVEFTYKKTKTWFKGCIERSVLGTIGTARRYEVFYDEDKHRYVQTFDEETMLSTFTRKNNVRYNFRWSPPAKFRGYVRRSMRHHAPKVNDSYVGKRVSVSLPDDENSLKWYQGTIKRIRSTLENGTVNYEVKYDDNDVYVQDEQEASVKEKRSSTRI